MPDGFDATASVVGLARTLRAAGVAASPDRVQSMVQALAALDPSSRSDVYWAGRLTLCGTPEELARYDRVFDAYFGERPSAIVKQTRVRPVTTQTVGPAGPGIEGRDAAADDPQAPAAASVTEVLRHRDLSSLGAVDRALLSRLLAAFAMPGELRRTRRHVPHHRGRVDPSRTTRELLRHGGEPARLRHQISRQRHRRVVLLVDVSGSMSGYADALLRFAHAATRRRGGVPTEVFTIGTRLTRVTREMARRDPDGAMRAVAGAVPDWSGGTRLGEMVKEFLDRWGQRGLARGAVVVVLSDGWERDDAALLGAQMARLHRLAHRVVWANPRKAAPGYAPLAAGMAAALPHVDDFVDGHSLAALERLAQVVVGHA